MNWKIIAIIGIIATIAIGATIIINQEKEPSEMEKAIEVLDNSAGYIYYKSGTQNECIYVKNNTDVKINGDYVDVRNDGAGALYVNAHIKISTIYKIKTLDGQTWNFDI